MTWLVLCGQADLAGRWAADELRRRVGPRVELVTDADFAGAAWDHRVGDTLVTTELRLADGRTLAQDDIQVTLNRLTHAPPAMAALLAPADRDYGYAECSALLMSWLGSLEGPVLNPPTTRGLCGAWRSDLEWAVLAAEAGLRSVSLEDDSGTSASESRAAGQGPAGLAGVGPVGEDAIVAGTMVFSARPLDPETRDACRRLATIAANPLLGLRFDDAAGDGQPRLRGATPLPDLRAGGPELIDAIVAAIS